MTREELEALLQAAETGDPAQPSPHLDARWDALAHDELSDEDRAALAALAESDDGFALAQQAFSPLGDDFLDRVEAALPAVSPPQATERPVRSAPSAPGLLKRLTDWLRHPVVLVPLGVMAATVVMVMVPDDPQLATYSFEIQGGEQTFRDGIEPTSRYSEGASITIILKPEVSASTELAVAVALDDWGSTLDVEPMFSENGTILLSGEIGLPPWLLPVGEHTLLVGVGPEGTAQSDAAWQTWSGAVEVVP